MQKTQYSFYEESRRKLAEAQQHFMMTAGLMPYPDGSMEPNPITRQDLVSLINRRPEVYAQFAGLFNKLTPKPDLMINGRFMVGSVLLEPFTKKSVRNTTCWGIRVVETGKEFNPADGNGAWFKSGTKQQMIDDINRSYEAGMKLGDPLHNENRWRCALGLPAMGSPAMKMEAVRREQVILNTVQKTEVMELSSGPGM